MGLNAAAIEWRGGALYLHGPTGVESGPVRAILFDLGGTLDADGSSWGERFRHHWAALKLEPDAGAAVAALEAGERAVLDHPDAARLGLAAMVRLHVDAQLAALNCDDRVLGDALVERFTTQTDANLRGRRPLLRALAAVLPLGVVSNGCGNSGVLVAEAGLSDLFRTVVDSSQVGFWKPDPRILEPARSVLGVDAAEVAVVGDRVDRDAEAARGAGMHAVWVTGPEPVERDDARLAQVDAVIDRVEALWPEPRS